MENASRALIIAGAVLIAVLILSIGVYLFYTYAQYSSNVYEKIESSQASQFNSQFLKYYGMTYYTITDASGKEKVIQERIKCTVHDVITLANLAQQNNQYYQVQDLTGYNENTNYIQVDIGTNKKNIEKWNNDEKTKFITQNQNKYYYICDPQANMPMISSVTKRICYIRFKEI